LTLLRHRHKKCIQVAFLQCSNKSTHVEPERLVTSYDVRWTRALSCGEFGNMAHPTKFWEKWAWILGGF